jgi:peptidoglycan/xylan/chitin deacetylase (PgdA/CDA1 family)
MTDALVKIRISRVEGVESLAWSENLSVQLPTVVANVLGNGRDFLTGVTITPATTERARALRSKAMHESLRLRAAFTDRPPPSSRLPISYHLLPAWLRAFIGSAIGGMKRRQVAQWADFPGWPIDLSTDFLADLFFATGHSPFAGKAIPVLLSHDIDSPKGLRTLVSRFLDIEERVGARSINYVIPCAWQLDVGLLDEVQRRGHEIGTHGYDHSNRTPFAEPSERRYRLEAARPLVERYGITGYRAPSLLRTEALLIDLASFYRHDSSVPTAGGLFPVPNNGCASARPWRIGRLWEFPLTLPRDGSLRFLGYKPAHIGRLWRETAETVVRSGGIISLLTHCEAHFTGNPSMLSVYRDFVEWLASDTRFCFTRPRDLVEQLDAQGAT